MGCTADMRYRATCNVDRLSQIKSPAFQYFSDPNMYGLSPYTDYCPYFWYGVLCGGGDDDESVDLWSAVVLHFM